MAFARELGRLVRDRRAELGLSQTDLADRCGMKQPQISRLETGGTVPTLPLLRRLARALDSDLTISLTPHDGGGQPGDPGPDGDDLIVGGRGIRP
ncbi:helix-turn-helix domain-containing protein [Streptomyces sp. NPDC021020]|uniref:helix-turn-helix domain-containing protein n=1 Tax=Streptomyces sp. NPDC021020 TaxID=3365109 RepID=UPI0037B03525